MKTYTTLEQIGINSGSETIMDICKAMPDKSILTAVIGSSANSSIYPDNAYGILIVTKQNTTRMKVEFAKNGRNSTVQDSYVKYVYSDSSGSEVESSWFKNFCTNNITCGTSPLTSGTSSLTTDCIYQQYE